MATFKAMVRTPRKDGFYQVYIRVVHNTKPGYIKTDKVVTAKQLDKHGDITDPFVNSYCSQQILNYADRLNRVDISSWSVKQVIEFLMTESEDICFSDYARTHIDRMIDNGQLRNSKNYKLALGHMERFFGTTQIMFGHLTSIQMNRWIKSLESTHRAKEMYPVCMRQVF